MRRTKEDAEKTRRAILASAMNLFYEKGYSKATFEEMAKRINLTKGAVYWHFRNKPDVVAAMINDFTLNFIANIKQRIQQYNEPDFQNIIDIELFINHKIKNDDMFYKFMFFISCQMEWSEAVIKKIQPSIAQTKHIVHELFLDVLLALQKQGKIRSDVDVNLINEILINLYNGVLNSYFSKRTDSDIDVLVTKGFNLIFDSIKTERCL